MTGSILTASPTEGAKMTETKITVTAVAKHALELVRKHGQNRNRSAGSGLPTFEYTSGDFKVRREAGLLTIAYKGKLVGSGRAKPGWEKDESKIDFMTTGMTDEIRTKFMVLS